jgi:CRISPR-associated endonuclease Cas3-HD
MAPVASRLTGGTYDIARTNQITQFAVLACALDEGGMSNSGDSVVSGSPTPFAHSKAGEPLEAWEPLREHLEKVARLAGEFASAFGATEWGHLAGLWHDLGKYSGAFQRYLKASSVPESDAHRADVAGRVDHSTAGAQHAASLGRLGELLAYVIAGHHAGLPDDVGGASGLAARLQKRVEPYDAAPADLLRRPLPRTPRLETDGGRSRKAFSIGFFTRMIFSCLVDADFLATEEFMAPERAEARPRQLVGTAQLLEQLDTYLDQLQVRAEDTEVNCRRREVLAACRAKAEVPPARNYGATIVLCTATQPAVERRENFPIGLDGIRRIIDDPARLHTALRRAEIAPVGIVDDAELVERLRREPQVLCIVNSRGHSTSLFRLLNDPDALHLSASLCGAHRSEILKKIGRRLDDGAPCRVICTQVIEAGVDVDFPIVYRAVAGLDSIAQAAGRCNREGRLRDEKGRSVLGRRTYRYHKPPRIQERGP